MNLYMCVHCISSFQNPSGSNLSLDNDCSDGITTGWFLPVLELHVCGTTCLLGTFFVSSFFFFFSFFTQHNGLDMCFVFECSIAPSPSLLSFRPAFFLLSTTVLLNEGLFGLQRTLENVWRQFWSSQLNRGHYWQLVGRGKIYKIWTCWFEVTLLYF